MIKTTNTPEETCLGHLGVRMNERCRGCTPDKFNTWCEDYRPVNIYRADVLEGEKECTEEMGQASA